MSAIRCKLRAIPALDARRQGGCGDNGGVDVPLGGGNDDETAPRGPADAGRGGSLPPWRYAASGSWQPPRPSPARRRAAPPATPGCEGSRETTVAFRKAWQRSSASNRQVTMRRRSASLPRCFLAPLGGAQTSPGAKCKLHYRDVGLRRCLAGPSPGIQSRTSQPACPRWRRRNRPEPASRPKKVAGKPSLRTVGRHLALPSFSVPRSVFWVRVPRSVRVLFRSGTRCWAQGNRTGTGT